MTILKSKQMRNVHKFYQENKSTQNFFSQSSVQGHLYYQLRRTRKPWKLAVTKTTFLCIDSVISDFYCNESETVGDQEMTLLAYMSFECVLNGGGNFMLCMVFLSIQNVLHDDGQ